MKKFEVIAVNISEEKGTVKHPVEHIILNENGIEGDAHAGKWHRQVSLLARESIEKAEETAGVTFPDGTFAENITTKGIELHLTNILDRFVNDDIELEVTQIGKKCHAKCAIGKQVGNCIMPLEGIFARVINGGVMKAGDTLVYIPKVFKIKIVTLSDRASSGEYEDKSGPLIRKLSEEWAVAKRLSIEFEEKIIPDEAALLSPEIQKACSDGTDIVFTTGSTGLGERDIAPETIRPLLDREIPGIMELIRVKHGMEKPNALLSRSLAGVTGRTLVFALPGSPKAVAEYMEEITKILFHAILMVHGIGDH
ncbi:MAG: molybdenum cofactor synthesis domain-containing protein [Bacteroidota bacterium]